MKRLLSCLLILCTLRVNAQEAKPRIPVHDPVMIKQDSTYYIFCTGRGIAVWSSKNKVDWTRMSPVFTKTPEWAIKAIPNAKPNDFWAPDISYHNGTYYLYYAVSVFGKNTSVIGLAINKTLDVTSPDFKWEDQGLVIQSAPGLDMFNAIDPNLVRDERNNAWLTFGSFWDGIKLVKLNADMKTPAQDRPWKTIASRTHKANLPDSVAGNAAIEAPFIFKKNQYYYLFTSWDYCCRGPKSTYKMMVGRSKTIDGPYLDQNGTDLANGGGTLVLAGDKDWYGVGHNAVCSFDGEDYIIFHAYDAADNGRSKLRIEKLVWKNSWPVIAK
jgi:arabinan endo-1,5-alpha-L-arabinosidase